MSRIAPASTADLCEAITHAAAARTHLEIRCGGSKSAIGADCNVAVLDMRGFNGVIDYDPPELILTVRAATPLAEVQALVAGQQQMLAFEPWDHGPLFGQPAGAATIGGVVAAAVAGPRRLSAGGARDHLLGFKAVSGRGEAFVGGAKVVKNVTGYDLPKLMGGSWGRLAAITELTLKVLPLPRCQSTMVVQGLDERQAHAAMAQAMGCHAEVAAAAHLPAAVNDGTALTALLVQGFEPSVAARCALLPGLLRDHGRLHMIEASEADSLWQKVRSVAPLADGRPLWRIVVPPSASHGVVATLQPLGARWLFDWAGGLIWLSFDGAPALVRQTAEHAGGHAMLVRAPPELRASVPAQHPRQRGVANLEARVRRAFDPGGVFETGRFLDNVNAN